MPQPKDNVIGKRVRINEVPDKLLSKNYLGKMATVKGLDRPDAGSPNCLLKIDRVTELILLPATYLETLEPQPSSLLANDLFLPWDMNDPKTRLDAFLADKWLAGHILEMMMFGTGGVRRLRGADGDRRLDELRRILLQSGAAPDLSGVS